MSFNTCIEMEAKGAHPVTEKLTLGILCGGRSGEHEVSLRSAGSVFQAVDKSKFEPLVIGISKEGNWYLPEDPQAMFDKGVVEEGAGIPVAILGQPGKNPFVALNGQPLPKLDVVFPVLHGTFGEDGTIQGLLELARIPYVGAGVMASAVGMDKVMMKKVFRQAGLPVVDDIFLLRSLIRENPEKVLDYVEEHIPYPCFVKPANLGSSVGVCRAENREELGEALIEAAKFDSKIVVEQGVAAREIECSVLGNDTVKCAVPGEVIPVTGFYDYEAKYITDDSELVIPAPLTAEQVEEIHQLAARAYAAIECSGLARVDFFLLKDTGEILVNEINTLPGFTSISMYSKLWEASGLPYQQLITQLVTLAFERFEEKRANPTTYK